MDWTEELAKILSNDASEAIVIERLKASRKKRRNIVFFKYMRKKNLHVDLSRSNRQRTCSKWFFIAVRHASLLYCKIPQDACLYGGYLWLFTSSTQF